MTHEDFVKAPLLDQILYDTTGMLAENNPSIAEAMDKYHQAKLKLLGITNVSKSFTAEEVVNELEDCDTLDDAIMFFKEQMFKMIMKTKIKIKQLEWENRFESTDEFGIKAQTPFCTYTIIDMKGTRFAKGIHLSGTDGMDVEVSSFDEGKKLAQADFERRIKECLITE